jgi:hypothetical protein
MKMVDIMHQDLVYGDCGSPLLFRSGLTEQEAASFLRQYNNQWNHYYAVPHISKLERLVGKRAIA